MPWTTHRTGYHRFSDRYLGKPAELYTGLILQKPEQHEISSDRRKHQNEVLTLTYPSEKSAAPHAKMVLSDRAVEASVSPHLPFGDVMGSLRRDLRYLSQTRRLFLEARHS